MTDLLIEAYKAALPDSRPREQRGQIQTPFGLATPVYCASCGRFGGYVFVSTEFMFWLCDDRCDKYGQGLDVPMVDPEMIAAVNRGG